MNDRELLEAAATAAGLHNHRYIGPGMAERIDAASGGSKGPIWNPIDDDGDAMRLAVSLSISIQPDEETYVFAGKDIHKTGLGYSEYHNGDKLAATRRAIVRAAANIGEQHGTN